MIPNDILEATVSLLYKITEMRLIEFYLNLFRIKEVDLKTQKLFRSMFQLNKIILATWIKSTLRFNSFKSGSFNCLALVQHFVN